MAIHADRTASGRPALRCIREPSRYAQLLGEGLAPEPFVRCTLALPALADGEMLGLVTPAVSSILAEAMRWLREQGFGT